MRQDVIHFQNTEAHVAFLELIEIMIFKKDLYSKSAFRIPFLLAKDLTVREIEEWKKPKATVKVK